MSTSFTWPMVSPEVNNVNIRSKMAAMARATHHHGDLRRALVDAGVELARSAGAAAVVLREVARRLGVSPAAMYRHFPDREALLGEVAHVARRELAGRMLDELDRVESQDLGRGPGCASGRPVGPISTSPGTSRCCWPSRSCRSRRRLTRPISRAPGISWRRPSTTSSRPASWRPNAGPELKPWPGRRSTASRRCGRAGRSSAPASPNRIPSRSSTPSPGRSSYGRPGA